MVQDSIRGAHWNNDQVTIHPFAIYYKKDDKEVCCNYVAISECLKHDTIAVHVFQEGLVKFLKKTLGPVSKIFYFSDGASVQYKNKKNFLNLTFHVEDFGIPAEWHFFATSHGKGPCDGLGGTVKRLAARASLSSLINPINSAVKFYDWVNKNVKNIHTEFFNNYQYQDRAKHLKERFEKAKTISGTLGYHAFIPQPDKIMKVQTTSSSEQYCMKMVYKA